VALKFANTGEDPAINPDPIWVGRRQWDACVEYKFISAGQHPKYSSQLFRLNVDDIFAAYSTGRGYLGIGQVCEKAIEIRNFSFNGESFEDFNIRPDIVNGNLITTDIVPNRRFLRQTVFCNALNDNTEFAVRVKWLRNVTHNEAKWRQGLFAKQHIVCNMSNQIETIGFLSEEFGIELR